MRNNNRKRYTAAGLLVGGFIIFGTVLGGLIGFILGGGASEFQNQGHIWMTNGLTLGSLGSTGFGLLWLTSHIKKGQKEVNEQLSPHITAGLVFGALVTLGIAIGGFAGFLFGGGVSEFTTGGWAWKVAGIIFGLLIGAGLGLVNWALQVKTFDNVVQN